MVSSSYSRAEEIRQGTNNSDLRKISDQQLVRLCLENNRPAWEEFFRRFIPTIKKAIKEKLGLSVRPNLCFDEEVLWNIHEKIVVKLYNNNEIIVTTPIMIRIKVIISVRVKRVVQIRNMK